MNNVLRESCVRLYTKQDKCCHLNINQQLGYTDKGCCDRGGVGEGEGTSASSTSDDADAWKNMPQKLQLYPLLQ